MASTQPVLLRPEHDELRTSVRKFLADTSPESAVRAVMETATGYDPDVWRRACDELGLAALIVPEQYGGGGYSFVEIGVVLEESGRVLWPSPLFATAVLATTAILSSQDLEAAADYLPPIAAGTLRATVATSGALVATRTNGTWQVTGTSSYVIDGHTAELVLVFAETEAGLSLFAVNGDAAGLTREAQSTMDLTRKLAAVCLEATPARLVGTEGAGADLLERVLAAAAVALAAEQVGGAQRLLELTVDYVKDRKQFGRAIGSFQAVKHRCADMLVDVETARAVMVHALWSVATDSDELAEDAATAKVFCSDAYLSCAGAAIQLHGGIGFTWEHSAHLFFKRAKTSQLIFGHPVHHRRHLGDLLDL
ncbi:MAG TPA: acyl-CoA dehydrogenase family protein [Mycobacteriales bacterium]|nr:acyl-CoA dehydrogenase family protein [Mycobacteriales bacterium]